MFSQRATSNAALAAGSVGAVVAYLVAYRSPISFLWPSTFGFAATLIVGAAVTALARQRPQKPLTWTAVLARREVNV
jgi:hypothetical protein